MKIQCAWCKKDMGEKPPYEDPATTHSICDECLAKQLKAVNTPEKPSPEFRERLLARLSTELKTHS